MTRTQTEKYAKTEKFPCQVCAGTGRYRGVRVHQEKAHCFACKGQGYHLTSPADRAKAKQQRVARKERIERESAEAFDNANPGLRDFLRSASDWSEFAASLYCQLSERHSLSDKQTAAAKGMRAKVEAAQAAAAVAPKPQVDLTPIRTMFETALANGYKKPTYRAEGLIINRAPNHGRNPGALYVKNEQDVYGGKVLGTAFTASRDGERSDFAEGRTALDALVAIAADPLAAALRYGQRTGRCACCGRELTNHVSIDLGIGPICRGKWGL